MLVLPAFSVARSSGPNPLVASVSRRSHEQSEGEDGSLVASPNLRREAETAEDKPCDKVVRVGLSAS